MAVILPVMLLLLFVYVFGGAIQTGGDYVELGGPGDHPADRGLRVRQHRGRRRQRHDRRHHRPVPVAAHPAHRGADRATSSRSMARNAVSTALVFGIAFLIGFDAAASPLEWVGAIGLIALFVLALTWVAVAIGIVASGPEAASGFTFAILFLPYVSSAFVPPESMPVGAGDDRHVQPDHPGHGHPARAAARHAGRGLVGSRRSLWCLGIFVVGRVAAGAAVPSVPLSPRSTQAASSPAARPASAAGITPGRRTTLPDRRSAPGPSRRRREPRPTAAGRR